VQICRALKRVYIGIRIQLICRDTIDQIAIVPHSIGETMTETSAQTKYPNRNSPVIPEGRNGFEEQERLLSQLSQKLDEYFAMRLLKKLE